VNSVELSIVIGVYNEEEVLPELERRLTAALEALGRSYEIILVDDGSRDGSLAIMMGLEKRDPDHIRSFSFTRNFGHHIALTAGLDQARGDVIIMMDADLQDQPEEIHKLLEKLDEGYDVVWGERVTRQFKWYKNISSKLFLWIMNSVARAEVSLNSSIFRAMRASVARDLRKMREKARYLPGLVSWLGYRQTSVPVEHGKRFAGETKYSLWRLLKLALSTATSFSAAPLQLATISGLTAAAFAVLGVLYVFVRKLLGAYTVPGYASLMIAIFGFGALQLIVIGLMGEYISRIYGEAQGRPLYLLKDLGSEEPLRRHSASPARLSALSPDIKEDLLTIISSDSHLPLARIFTGETSHTIADYHLRSWQKSNPYVFLSQGSRGIEAACILSELEWDTKVLGVPVGRILYANSIGEAVDMHRIGPLTSALRDATSFARERDLHLIDARVSNEDLFVSRAFENAGFHIVDLLVTLGARAHKFEHILSHTHYQPTERGLIFNDGLLVRPMQPEDVDPLAHISEISYSDHSMIQDRFFLEPTISQERAQGVFREWFINLARRHAEGHALVLVAEVDGSPCGYVAIEPMAPLANEIWLRDTLNAVAPEARGRGIYRALIIAAIDYARSTGASGILTKTQSSTYRVINTWLHLGCDILENLATFHWTSSVTS